MTGLNELYQEVILHHSKSPRNFGKPGEFNRRADGDNPLCGDEISVYLTFEDGVVKDDRMKNRGNSENVPFKLARANQTLGVGAMATGSSSQCARSSLTACPQCMLA